MARDVQDSPRASKGLSGGLNSPGVTFSITGYVSTKLSVRSHGFRTLQSLVTRQALPLPVVFIPSAADIGLVPVVTLGLRTQS